MVVARFQREDHHLAELFNLSLEADTLRGDVSFCVLTGLRKRIIGVFDDIIRDLLPDLAPNNRRRIFTPDAICIV